MAQKYAGRALHTPALRVPRFWDTRCMTPEGTMRDSALLPLMGLSQLKTNATKSFYESHCPMHTGSEVSPLTAVLPASPLPPAHARCCPSPKSPPLFSLPALLTPVFLPAGVRHAP